MTRPFCCQLRGEWGGGVRLSGSLNDLELQLSQVLQTDNNILSRLYFFPNKFTPNLYASRFPSSEQKQGDIMMTFILFYQNIYEQNDA